MRIIHDLHWSPEFPDGSVATVGEFDGVHRGHRVVLLEMSRTAVVEGCPSVVVTFERYPSATPETSNVRPQLTDMEQKLELLEASGVDFVVVLPTMQTAPADVVGQRDDALDWIVDEVFTRRLKALAVVVGEEFHFSPRQRMTVDTFRKRRNATGFRIVQIPVESRQSSSGVIVSARAIRDSLEAGDVDAAARMLGRAYEIRSTVTTGERRGRTIGFPTANLPTPDTVQLPGDGVYACWYVRPDGTQFRAAVNIGKRPTFHSGQEKSLVEAHLLDFNGDLYREQARLRFIERIRSETKFGNLESFKVQLNRDIAEVRRRLTA